jgi:hypothetical protein
MLYRDYDSCVDIPALFPMALLPYFVAVGLIGHFVIFFWEAVLKGEESE